MPPEDSLPEVGSRLRTLRLLRGFSQGTVARRAEIAPSYLSRIETGKVQPTFRTVLRVLRALRAQIEEIVDTTQQEGRRGGCPVSHDGSCLLGLIRPEAQVAVGGDFYSPREIRLLRRMAEWLRRMQPDRLRAMEILLDDLTRPTDDRKR